jgi:hypothetical protein
MRERVEITYSIGTLSQTDEVVFTCDKNSDRHLAALDDQLVFGPTNPVWIEEIQ